MLVRILDWNVCNENRAPPEKIVDFIFSHNPDIICLQEVPRLVLDTINSRVLGKYERVMGNDMRCGEELCFLVTLSRFPIIKWRAIQALKKGGWRSFFSSFWHNIEEHLESLRVDILVERRRVRVLNVHLEVGTGPKNRLQQFRHVLRHGIRRWTIKSAIIAGDLNIYGQGWYERFVGWLWFGLRSVELLLNEREEFERIFKKRGLKNIFREETTFSTGGVNFQFDHILVPRNTVVISRSVISEHCGSDHTPIIGEIDI
ncbi:MAG: endonuclease/exonuclease/phosphatase family protein [bacterium]|nr:endonuclease/exonuclease/phosphatase family protein [bacterium]